MICTATNSTPHNWFFGFLRQRASALRIADWLAPNNGIYVYIKTFVRNKSDPLVKPVQVVEVVNDQFVRVQRPDGSIDTVSFSKASRGNIAPHWKRSESTEQTTMEADFRPSEMEHGNGIAPMDGEFDQEVITQPEQAGQSSDSFARQSVTRSAEVHKDQVKKYFRPRRARKAPERY